MYSGSASASPAYASSPVAPPAVKSSKGKDKMSPVRMPAAGSSQVQVSRGSPRVQRQIKMEFDHDGTEIIMPALPFTAQSERQVWLDEAPRGPWPGPKNGGSMPSVTGVFKAWSAKKYAKVASVKSYKGGGKMLLRCSTRVKNGVVIGSDNEEGDSEVEILDDCDRCPFKAHIRTTVDGQYYYLVKSSSTLIHTCIQDPSPKSAPSASYISTLQTVTNAVKNDPNITAKGIQGLLASADGLDIPLKKIYRARGLLRHQVVCILHACLFVECCCDLLPDVLESQEKEEYTKSYQLFDSWCKEFKKINPGMSQYLCNNCLLQRPVVCCVSLSDQQHPCATNHRLRRSCGS